MAILSVQKPSIAGTVRTFANAAVGGDSFPNTGVEFVVIKNNHASAPRTVTFDSPGQCSFGAAANAAHDQPVIVAAQTERLAGPFSKARFNDANGRVAMTYSDAAADIQIAVLAPA